MEWWITFVIILNIVTMSNCLQFIHKFNEISVKIPASYFVNIDNLVLKFIERGKRTRMANLIFIEEKKTKDFNISAVRLQSSSSVVLVGK